MPVRIKPSYDLGTCRLSLKGIEEIIARISEEFSNARFSASDTIWEIFDEASEVFLQHISQRKSLESFSIEAQKNDPDSVSLRMVFNKKEATVFLVSSPKHQEWFEHFLIDIKNIWMSLISVRFLHMHHCQEI